jgi:hypothetical protein
MKPTVVNAAPAATMSEKQTIAAIDKAMIEAETSQRHALRKMKEAGALLVQMKAKIAHGKWLAWIKENFRHDATTAQRLMRLHEGWAQLGRGQTIDSLSLTQALEIIKCGTHAAFENDASEDCQLNSDEETTESRDTLAGSKLPEAPPETDADSGTETEDPEDEEAPPEAPTGEDDEELPPLDLPPAPAQPSPRLSFPHGASERQPGDDEQQEKELRKEDKKIGQPVFEWRTAETPFGQLTRSIESMAVAYKAPKHPALEKGRRLLNEAFEAIREAYKSLSKGG